MSHMNRRAFMTSTATTLSLLPLFSQTTFAQDSASLNDIQRQALQNVLQRMDEQYDPDEHMIVTDVSGVGYHTTLKEGKVHNTRTSLEYAVALLDSGEDDRKERAIDVIEKLISLQDQDPESRTYGIWSWYLEEPLDMMSPPDWNWADFCSVQLLAAWLDHRERLPEDTVEKIKDSIIHAAHSIKRRNVSMGYTNIAIMGTYVTLVTAEQFGEEEIASYAHDRVRRFYNHTLEQGTFNEYNSPTYSVVALTELSRIMMHVQNQEDRALVQELHDIAWEQIARHFHPPTRQWAGPHSRWYGNVLENGNSTLAFLEMGTGQNQWLQTPQQVIDNLRHYRIDINCPQQFHHYFNELREARFEQNTFIKHGNRTDTIGSTYLHPHFTLGTINQGDLWNQRRPFLAYWGSPENPTYFRLRFLHDDYDYTSAMFFSAQEQEHALASVVFATDYGDTHPSLDKIQNATIIAKDLRLRFEIGGAIDDIEVDLPNDNSPSQSVTIRSADETVNPDQPENKNKPIIIKDKNIRCVIHRLGAQFDGAPMQWVTNQENGTYNIDAIAYSGDETSINWSELADTFIAFAFAIHQSTIEPPQIAATLQKEDDQITSSWQNMKLSLPSKPGSRNDLLRGY